MSDTKDIPTIQECPACKVRILGDQVLFSSGSPGTRARLMARVCQFHDRPECINRGIPMSSLQEKDFYGEK